MESDKLIRLFRAFVKADNEAFHTLAWETIEDEKRKKHHLLAKELEDILKASPQSTSLNGVKQLPPIPRDNEKGFRLLDVRQMYCDWSDAILSQETELALKQIVTENQQSSLLATYGLKPKNKILFYGPPGTGKTLSAKVLSSVIGYPLVLVRFDAVISSFLGETASNLRKVFDFIEAGRWTVLFDEFDIIGKQRDDPAEHGEIKRVVNNFMLMLENYEGESLIISSTNHPHLLDVAVWRRFDDVIYFSLPSKSLRRHIFDKYLRVLKKESDFDLEEVLKHSEKFSGSDIQHVCVEALKNDILHGREVLSQSSLLKAVLKQKARLRLIR